MGKYEGWTNYETWAVALWINNEEPSHRYWHENGEEALSRANGNRQDAAIELADMLKDEFEEASENAVERGTVFADLLSAALSEVNWHEIAETFLPEKNEERQRVRESGRSVTHVREASPRAPFGVWETDVRPNRGRR